MGFVIMRELEFVWMVVWICIFLYWIIDDRNR